MKEKSNKSYAAFITVSICVILFAALTFHFVPSQLMVFPKENLTFSNTIITDGDIEVLVDRINNSSLFEQIALNNEPLVRKLREKGLIVEQNNQELEEEYLGPNEQWEYFWSEFTDAFYSKDVAEISRMTSKSFFDGGGGNTIEEWLSNIVFADDEIYNSFLQEVENGISVYEENYRATNKGIYFKYEDEKWMFGGVEED